MGSARFFLDIQLKKHLRINKNMLRQIIYSFFVISCDQKQRHVEKAQLVVALKYLVFARFKQFYHFDLFSSCTLGRCAVAPPSGP